LGDSEIIAGLGTRGTWVRGVPDLLQRAASAEEKALANSIGAGAQLRDVLASCGMPEARAIAVLLGMRLRGLVLPAKLPPGAAPLRPISPASPAPAPRHPGVDAAAMSEALDLDEARKSEVLALEARLESDDFFRVLGVSPGACAADCKKAYYELTKRFHPDRYFGKSLGSFKARIETIFRKLTEAQATLCDPPRRAEYLNLHPELTAAAAAPAMPGGKPPSFCTWPSRPCVWPTRSRSTSSP